MPSSRTRIVTSIIARAVVPWLAACVPAVVDVDPSATSTGSSDSGEPSPPVATDDDTTGGGPVPTSSSDDTSTGVPVCGNGIAEGDEPCDGEDLAGASCQDLYGYLGIPTCNDDCTLDVLGCLPPGMVLIPAEEFWMGSDAYKDDERPAHLVELGPYFIDVDQVTVAQYAECIGAAACPLPIGAMGCNFGVAGRDDHPINCVDWSGAVAYCEWAGGERPKRLPTEAEWEKAARGVDERLYPWGDSPGPSCTHVVMHDALGGGCGAMSSLPVGSRPQGDSPYGLHDMAGGVWDWVADWYAPYDLGDTIEPTGPATGTLRVLRGGGWDTVDVDWFRTSARNANPPESANRNVGFRCAVSPPPPP